MGKPSQRYKDISISFFLHQSNINLTGRCRRRWCDGNRGWASAHIYGVRPPPAGYSYKRRPFLDCESSQCSFLVVFHAASHITLPETSTASVKFVWCVCLCVCVAAAGLTCAHLVFLQPCCRRGARSWVASSCCVTRRTGRTSRREKSPCSPAWTAWSPASLTGQQGHGQASRLPGQRLNGRNLQTGENMSFKNA